MNRQDQQLLADTARFICTKQWKGVSTAPPTIQKYLDIQRVYDATSATLELRSTDIYESLYWGNRLIPDRCLRENQDKQQYAHEVRLRRRGSRLRLPTAEQAEQLQDETDELITNKHSIAKRRRSKRRDPVYRVREPLLDQYRKGIQIWQQLAQLDKMRKDIWQSILHCYLRWVLMTQKTIGEDGSLSRGATPYDMSHQLYNQYSKRDARLHIYIGDPIGDDMHGHVVTDTSGGLIYSRLYGAPRGPHNFTAAYHQPPQGKILVA